MRKVLEQDFQTTAGVALATCGFFNLIVGIGIRLVLCYSFFMQPKILITKTSADYELIDSGNGEKLERYGKYILRRPDPQALWNKNLSEDEWKNNDAVFDNERKSWKFTQNDFTRNRDSSSLRDGWQIAFDDLKFNIKPTAFKHTGVFPEQSSNWQFIKEKIENRISSSALTANHAYGRSIIPYGRSLEETT